MTNAFSIILLGLLLCAVESATVPAEAGEQLVKGELQLVYVFEGKQPEFIFVIGQAGFKSVASLKKHLETWPAGSELKWAPGCVRFGGEPLLSSDKEMQAFRAFLAERGIALVLVPSG